jgi:hypothetical protein
MDQRGFLQLVSLSPPPRVRQTSLAAAITAASVPQANAVGWSVTRRRLD